MRNIERLPIDSDLLQTFAVIARCGNLTIAAGRLGRTQSAISVQLRKLEDGLGARLFARSARGMILTPAGEMLLPRAKSILTGVREAAELFAKPLTGSIRVGLPDDFDEAVLEHVLTAFARAHPGVQVRAASGCTSGYAAAVRDGGLDVAVCSGPDNRRGEPLGVEQTVWAARKGASPWAGGVVPLAVLDRNCWWRDLPTAALEAAGVSYEVAFRSSNFASLQAALRAGFAVGLLPKSCIGGALRALTAKDGFPELPESRRTVLVADHAPKPLARAMVDAIRGARAPAA